MGMPKTGRQQLVKMKGQKTGRKLTERIMTNYNYLIRIHQKTSYIYCEMLIID